MKEDSNLDVAAKRQQLQNDFVGNVTLHGYRYLFESGIKRRCVWWIFFLGALAFAIWLFFGAVTDYFKYESFTTVKFDYDIGQLEFPSLTLCNHQPYTTLNSHKIPIKADSQFFNVIFKDVLSAKSGNLSTQAQNQLKQLEENGIDTYEKLVEILTININDTLYGNVTKAFLMSGCTFEQQKCSHEDFKIIQNFEHSTCQQYNYYSKEMQSKTQKHLRKEFWFEAYFNLHDDKALGVDVKGKGITLYIHDRNRPHYEAFDIAFTLQPGLLTTVTFEELKTMKFLPPPHGECGTQPYRIIKDYPYSYPMCKIDCYLDSLYNKCGCVEFPYKDFLKENIKVCSIKEMVECYNIMDLENIGNTKSCTKACHQECVQNRYPLRRETVSLISTKHTMLVKKYTGWNKTDAEVDDYVRQNIVGLRIGFGNIVQRRETVTPSVTISSLLGTIGGSIGLGLGFSVLTLVEFMLFFVDYLNLCCFGNQQHVQSDRPV